MGGLVSSSVSNSSGRSERLDDKECDEAEEEKKEGLQEEFFHTFNSLIDKSSQIIISADRAPMKLDRVQERIKSRLAEA